MAVKTLQLLTEEKLEMDAMIESSVKTLEKKYIYAKTMKQK